MKREQIEKIINPKEYNKHWYTEDGWKHLERISASLEKVYALCEENNMTQALDDIMYPIEDDYMYRLFDIYRHIRKES